MLGAALCGVGYQMTALVPGTHVLGSLFANKTRIFGIYFTFGSVGGICGPWMVVAIMGDKAMVEVDGGKPKGPRSDTKRFLLTPKSFAYLRISEGCDHTCTFCAIPKMRGKNRSKPIDVLVEEAKNLDAVFLVLLYHDTVWLKTDREKMNRAVFAALSAKVGSCGRPNCFVSTRQPLPMSSMQSSSCRRARRDSSSMSGVSANPTTR